jgi:hypothetical protein
LELRQELAGAFKMGLLEGFWRVIKGRKEV